MTHDLYDADLLGPLLQNTFPAPAEDLDQRWLEISAKARKHRRRKRIGAVAVTAVILGGASATTVMLSSRDNAHTSSEVATPPPTLSSQPRTWAGSCPTHYPVGPPPKPTTPIGTDVCDWLPVTDSLGHLRGYGSRLEWNSNLHQAPGDPGTPVYDTSGTLQGYVSTCFIDLQTARDPVLVAQVKTHPDLILAADGKLVTAQEWARRVKNGTARVR
jgi:hypothetical protein